MGSVYLAGDAKKTEMRQGEGKANGERVMEGLTSTITSEKHTECLPD